MFICVSDTMHKALSNVLEEDTVCRTIERKLLRVTALKEPAAIDSTRETAFVRAHRLRLVMN